MSDLIYHECANVPANSVYKMFNGLWYLEAETEDGHTAGYYIKFCPFCGEKL